MSQQQKTLSDYNVSIDVGTILACKMYLKEILLDISVTQPRVAHQIAPGMKASVAFLDEYLKEKGISYETE